MEHHVNVLIYLRTPWCRIFFENHRATQLVKQYPAFFMEMTVYEIKRSKRVFVELGQKEGGAQKLSKIRIEKIAKEMLHTICTW